MTPDPEIVGRLRAAGCVFAEEEATVLAEAAAAVAGTLTSEEEAAGTGGGEDQARGTHASEDHTRGTHGSEEHAGTGGGEEHAGTGGGEHRTAGPHTSEDQAATLEAMVRRRIAGEPLEQVVGFADFCGVRVRLRPGVFVPRVRSELLVRLAVDELRAGRDGSRPDAGPPGSRDDGVVVVDLCCGSGALGLAVRRRHPDITVHAADVDPVAVACARDNLGADVHEGDLYEALPPRLKGRVGVLIANVPYVATRHLEFLPAEARDHEPRTALDGGADGLAIFREVAARAREWLTASGVLLSEITAAQAGTAVAIARGNGLTATVATDDDLDAYAIIARPAPGR